MKNTNDDSHDGNDDMKPFRNTKSSNSIES